MATAAEEITEINDTLDPPHAEHEWVVRDPGGETRVYIQRPLSFKGKLQVAALIGKTTKAAMADGLTLDGVMDNVDGARDGDLSSFMGSILTLVEYAPDLISDLLLISLHVPAGQREWVEDVWSRSESEGGLSDDQGFEMVEVFIDQNAVALRDFFAQRIQKLVDRTRSRLAPEVPAKSPRSKR